MAIGANSYGSLEEVAAMVPRFATASGSFDATTNPTDTRVEKLVDRISALVNGVLASQGFSVPVTQTDAKLMMDNIVVEHVTLLVEGIRGTGRYAPQSKEVAKRSPIAIISEEITTFIEMIAPGLEDLGASRDTAVLGRIAYKATDNAGDASFPIFGRKNHGNVFKDWDPA